MNISTIFGLIFGIFIITCGIYFSTESPMAFLNLPGLAIVLGGVFAATMISFPIREVFKVFKTLRAILGSEKTHVQNDLKEIVEVAGHWFKSDLSRTQSVVNRLHNQYLKAALELVLDDVSAQEIQNFLNWRILKLQAAERAQAQIFITMASYSPAFGMIGTLIGLINMLQSMSSQDFAGIGGNMAIALVTTFYGILLSNMIFKPVAIKFERRTEQRIMIMNIIIEAVTMIADRRSPAYIKETLQLLMVQYENELYQPLKIPG